jgi:hypothetical protein
VFLCGTAEIDGPDRKVKSFREFRKGVAVPQSNKAVYHGAQSIIGGMTRVNSGVKNSFAAYSSHIA